MDIDITFEDGTRINIFTPHENNTLFQGVAWLEGVVKALGPPSC